MKNLSDILAEALVKQHANKNTETGKINCELIDLNLPSGTLWADRNIGAKDSYDVGDYYAWSELKPKEEFTEETFTGNKTPAVLKNNTDTITYNYGNKYHMPTSEQIRELIHYTNHNKIDDNHVEFKSRLNKNSIIFTIDEFKSTDKESEYPQTRIWSNESVKKYDDKVRSTALSIDIKSGSLEINDYNCVIWCGGNLRAVSDNK